MDDCRSHTKGFFLSHSPNSQEALQKYDETLLIKSGPQQYNNTRHGRSGGGFRSTTTTLGEDFPRGHAVVSGLYAISVDANYIFSIADPPSESVAEGDQIPKSLPSWAMRGNFG